MTINFPTSNKNQPRNIINTPGQIDWSNPNIYISRYFRTVEVTQQDPNRFHLMTGREPVGEGDGILTEDGA